MIVGFVLGCVRCLRKYLVDVAGCSGLRFAGNVRSSVVTQW